MKTCAVAFTTLFALSSAGLASDSARAKASPEPVQRPLRAPEIGRVEICTPAVEGETQPCNSFDARQLEAFLTWTPALASQEGQLAFIDPVTLQPVAPTQEQLSELRDLAFSEETQSAGNELLVSEILADGTMMVRVGNRFHAQLSVVRGKGPTGGRSIPETVKP